MSTVLPFTPRPAPLRAPSAASLRAAVRLVIGEEIERLMGLLDALDGDPDAEPSLGWPESMAMMATPPTHDAASCGANGDARDARPFGSVDDREDDAGDDREPDEDREPIMGWAESADQADPRRFGEVWACDEEEASLQPAHWRPASILRERPAPAGEA